MIRLSIAGAGALAAVLAAGAGPALAQNSFGTETTLGIQGNSSVPTTGLGATGDSRLQSPQWRSSQYQYSNSGPGFSTGGYLTNESSSDRSADGGGYAGPSIAGGAYPGASPRP